MDEHKARLILLDGLEVRLGALDKFVKLAHGLYAAESSSGHHEGQEHFASVWIGLDIGQLKTAQDVISHGEGVGHSSHAQGMVFCARNSGKVGDFTHAEDQMIIGHLHKTEAFSLFDTHDFGFRVDFSDMAATKPNLGYKLSDRIYDMIGVYRSCSDLRE